MGKSQFQNLPNNLIIDLHYDENRLTGFGSHHAPALFWQVQLHAHRLNPSILPDYVFRSIEAQLYARPQGGGVFKISHSRHIRIHRSIWRGFESDNFQVGIDLEFPITRLILEELERSRNGGKMSLHLQMQLSVEEHGLITVPSNFTRQSLCGLNNIQNLTLYQEFDVPQSEWIDRVLPICGYGKFHILEIPAADIGQCEILKNAFEALKQAQEHHRLGFYDVAVSRCRIALEEFFGDEPKIDSSGKKILKADGQPQMIKVLKRDWEPRLGKATYDWLNSMLGSIRNAANRAAHNATQHFDQFESQMLLAVTISLIGYAARISKYSNPPPENGI